MVWTGLAGAQSEEREAEGGIGGTGIVGVLTDFGSLIVAGARVETYSGTQFINAFGPIGEDSLQLGDALNVEATTHGGQLRAERVLVTHPLVGQISAISGNGRTLRVNGVRVILEGSDTGLRIGERAVVSGVWRGDSVYASRVTQTRVAQDVIAGTLDRRALSSFIGPVRLRGSGLGRIASGGYATLVGRYDVSRDAFVADGSTSGRFLQQRAPLRRLIVEGYLEPTREAPGYRVAGLGHSFARNLQLAPLNDQRVLFSGDYTGLFAASAATVLPEGLQARRRLLRQISQRG